MLKAQRVMMHSSQYIMQIQRFIFQHSLLKDLHSCNLSSAFRPKEWPEGLHHLVFTLILLDVKHLNVNIAIICLIKFRQALNKEHQQSHEKFCKKHEGCCSPFLFVILSLSRRLTDLICIRDQFLSRRSLMGIQKILLISSIEKLI